MIIDGSVRRIMKPEQPRWLTSLQNEMALITAEEAQKLWPGPNDRSGPYFNYRLEHVQQVERDALRLLEEIPADGDIVIASVWVHDRFQPQYEGDQHAARGATWVRVNLAGLGFPVQKVEAVAYAVEHHSDLPGGLPQNAIEARLLWDADKLSKVGPLQIVSYMCAHPAFPDQKISFTSIALLGLERLERARRFVECFYFEPARLIALERYKQQKAFFEAFANDVDV